MKISENISSRKIHRKPIREMLKETSRENKFLRKFLSLRCFIVISVMNFEYGSLVG